MAVHTPIPLDPELRAWLAVTRRLPPWPRMAGLANHVARRLWLRRQRPMVHADVLGQAMALDPHELVDGLLLFAPQLVDRHEVAALRAGLRPGDTFLDAGAHVGFYTLLAAAAVGSAGRVLAVEPDPVSRARLTGNIATNGHANVTLTEVALSDVAGRAHLGRAEAGNRGGSSLLKADRPGIEVPCAPLADVLRSAGITRVDAAKLDLEGYEHRVLARWFADLPAQDRPRWLLIEHHPALVHAAGGDALALLRRCGYRVRRLSRTNHLARRT